MIYVYNYSILIELNDRKNLLKLIYNKFMFNSREIAHVDMQLLQQFKILINFWRQIFLKVADVLMMIFTYCISIIASTL